MSNMAVSLNPIKKASPEYILRNRKVHSGEAHDFDSLRGLLDLRQKFRSCHELTDAVTFLFFENIVAFGPGIEGCNVELLTLWTD